MRTLSLLLVLAINASLVRAADLDELGEHRFADSGDVRIHYVTKGEGPLVVMLHGFPDYWYSWRHQIPALSKHFRIVAMDQRGYNQSGQPNGVENYTVEKLIGDVKAVIQALGETKATIVGHDWGGMVAWSFAMAHPEMTERLVVLNLPHPWCLQRELATNPTQQKNSQYARDFQQPNAHQFLTPTALAAWVEDAKARAHYVAAFERSSMESMLNYYKANYPQPPYEIPDEEPPKVKCSVLLIHGLGDIYLLASGLNDTWKYVERDLTIVTIPDAKHFVHHDQPEFVTSTILNWLQR